MIDDTTPLGPRRLPGHQDPGVNPVAQSQPLWSLLQVVFGLAVLWVLVWGVSLLTLRWRGPTLPGAKAVASIAAQRTDDQNIQALLATMNAGEIYTFDELQAAATIIRRADQAADHDLFTDLFFGLLVGAGLLVLAHEGIRGLTARRSPVPIASPIGVLDDQGTFIPRPLPTPRLSRVSRNTLTHLPWMQAITPLTPLASALLEMYGSAPEWPAASKGQHGDATLLQHVLGVRARALALAEQDGTAPALAELVALGHDLGKLVTLRPSPDHSPGPDAGWSRLSPRHSRMSVLIMGTLPEWQTFTQEDRDDLTIAIAFHHQPDQIPVSAGLRARALLALLRHADGLATMRETREAERSDRVPPETSPVEPDPKGIGDHTSEAPATGGWQSHTDTAPAVTILTLEGRVAQALERLIPVLRINTRPFDGRADPDAGILMLLDRALRRALGPQLSASDQQALGLTPVHTTRPLDPSAEPLPHPATHTLAAALRTLGWLIDTRDSQQGIVWETRIGRLSWRDSWLLRLDAMPHALRERWGRSIWPIEVLGPTWPVVIRVETPLEDQGDRLDNTVIDNHGDEPVPPDMANNDMDPVPPHLPDEGSV